MFESALRTELVLSTRAAWRAAVDPWRSSAGGEQSSLPWKGQAVVYELSPSGKREWPPRVKRMLRGIDLCEAPAQLEAAVWKRLENSRRLGVVKTALGKVLLILPPAVEWEFKPTPSGCEILRWSWTQRKKRQRDADLRGVIPIPPLGDWLKAAMALYRHQVERTHPDRDFRWGATFRCRIAQQREGAGIQSATSYTVSLPNDIDTALQFLAQCAGKAVRDDQLAEYFKTCGPRVEEPMELLTLSELTYGKSGESANSRSFVLPVGESPLKDLCDSKLPVLLLCEIEYLPDVSVTGFKTLARAMEEAQIALADTEAQDKALTRLHGELDEEWAATRLLELPHTLSLRQYVGKTKHFRDTAESERAKSTASPDKRQEGSSRELEDLLRDSVANARAKHDKRNGSWSVRQAAYVVSATSYPGCSSRWIYGLISEGRIRPASANPIRLSDQDIEQIRRLVKDRQKRQTIRDVLMQHVSQQAADKWISRRLSQGKTLKEIAKEALEGHSL